MVVRCVAACCSLTHKDGIHLYSFPKDPSLRKKWADQVRRTRDKWEPTDYSHLCSKHFEHCCFEPYSNLSLAMGLGKRKSLLKPSAVPTIFEKPASLKRKLEVSEPETQPKKRRTAYEKRERARVSR